MDLFKKTALVLSAKHPRGVSSEVLFREALECLLDKKSPKRREERRMKRSQNRQKQQNPKANSLNIENKAKSPDRGPRIAGVVLKDKILKRDGYQCKYVRRGNVRCGCKKNLEIDHITAWAEGGATLEQNLRVLCSSHKFLAEKKFGVGYKKERFERG